MPSFTLWVDPLTSFHVFRYPQEERGAQSGRVAAGYSSAQLYVEGKKALWLALVVSHRRRRCVCSDFISYT